MDGLQSLHLATPIRQLSSGPYINGLCRCIITGSTSTHAHASLGTVGLPASHGGNIFLHVAFHIAAPFGKELLEADHNLRTLIGSLIGSAGTHDGSSDTTHDETTRRSSGSSSSTGTTLNATKLQLFHARPTEDQAALHAVQCGRQAGDESVHLSGKLLSLVLLGLAPLPRRGEQLPVRRRQEGTDRFQWVAAYLTVQEGRIAHDGGINDLALPHKVAELVHGGGGTAAAAAAALWRHQRTVAENELHSFGSGGSPLLLC